MQATYSICITCRNNINTVEASLESILTQTNDKFEIVVVDANSNDGTLEVLRKYAKKGCIKLIVKKCSRGKGRQIAFENSNGDYVIANMDLDDVFTPKLKELLDFHGKCCEGKILLAVSGISRKMRGLQNITIGDRNLLKRLGGWRDLQWAEDWDLWSRAAKSGCYMWTVLPIVEITNPHFERQLTLPKLLFRFYKYREFVRLGRTVFDKNEKVKLNRKLILATAKIAAFCKGSFRDDFNKTFDTYDSKYYVPFMHSPSPNLVL